MWAETVSAIIHKVTPRGEGRWDIFISQTDFNKEPDTWLTVYANQLERCPPMPGDRVWTTVPQVVNHIPGGEEKP